MRRCRGGRVRLRRWTEDPVDAFTCVTRVQRSIDGKSRPRRFFQPKHLNSKHKMFTIMKNQKKAANSIIQLSRAIVEEKIDIPNNAIVFTDAKLARKMLTPRKAELLEIIKISKPESLKELATITKRKKQAIERDIQDLKDMEVISLERTGRKVRPILKREIVIVAL